MSAGVCFKLVVIDSDGNRTGDVHLVQLSPPVRFIELEQNAKELLNASNVKFWYVDEEEDHCVISSQHSVDLVIRLNASKTSVRILVKVIEGAHESKEEPEDFCGSKTQESSPNKEQVLEGIRTLLDELKDIPSGRICKFRNMLNEVHTRVCARELEPVYPLPHDKFRLFLDAMINNRIADADFIQIHSGSIFMVPRDVIEFINTAMKQIRQDKEVNEMKELEKIKGRLKKLDAMHGIGVEYLVPPMTSNSQGGFIASASSTNGSGCEPFHAFGGGDRWFTSTRPNGSFIQIKLPSPRVSNIVFLGACNKPTEFRVEASGDGSNWVQLTKNETLLTYEVKVFCFDNDRPYSYYRIVILRSGDGSFTGFWRVNFAHY